MKSLGLSGRTARLFVDSKLTPLLIFATLALGAFAVRSTPREDQPTIEVPRAMVFIAYPGAGPRVVDQQIGGPVSGWLQEIVTVDDVESTALADGALFSITFRSGLDRSVGYSQLAEQLSANASRLPEGAQPPVIRMVGSEDVVAVGLTLWSETRSPYELGRIAQELASKLEEVEDVRAVEVMGGYGRQLRVELRLPELADQRISPEEVVTAIRGTHASLPADVLQGPGGSLRVETGTRLRTAAELGDVVVSGPAGPVPLRSLARIMDGPEEAQAYVSFGGRSSGGRDVAAVTLAVTKVRASDVGALSDRLASRLVALGPQLLPADVHLETVFDAGAEANEQVATILEHLLLAVVIVLLVITAGLGLRAGVIIAVVVPVVLAIVPLTYLVAGITLNEISIAAMIFSIGILSDDAVVKLENIARYVRAGGRKSVEVVARAVDEVGNPTIVATFTILASLLPTALVSGEMGQYTRPLPVGSSAAMFFSLLVALSVTPYLAYHFLPGRKVAQAPLPAPGPETAIEEEVPPRMYRFYSRILTPFLTRPAWRWGLYGVSGLVLGLALSLVAFRVVPVTLLLKGDSQTLVVVGELAPGATVERTASAGAALAAHLRARPDVVSYQLYAGTPGPLVFPGLPRALPEAPANRFELHVRLVPRGARTRQSHELARELRPDIRAVLAPHGARFKVKESPTGPARRAAVVAEVYGPLYDGQLALADEIRGAFEAEAGLTDVDVEPQPGSPRLRLEVDHASATARGIPPAAVARAVRIAVAGERAGLAHLPEEAAAVPIIVGLPRVQRSGPGDLHQLYLRGTDGTPVPLADLARFVRDESERAILRKGQLPVVYVSGELAKAGVESIYAQLSVGEPLGQLSAGGGPVPVRWFGPPKHAGEYSVAWAGEWEYTFGVYRDLGLAALGVVLLIYLLLVGWFRSFVDPLIIMLPIPLTLVGVIPAHWIAGISMTGLGTLGIIALAGIVARNSILLVEFARKRLATNGDLGDAVIRAGAVRTRPVVLTALTVILGDGVLILDPTLRGLGLSLASGALVTTALTLLLIPIIYHHVHARTE